MLCCRPNDVPIMRSGDASRCGSAAMHGRDEGLSPCPVVVAIPLGGWRCMSVTRWHLDLASVKASSLRLESQSPSAIVRKCENAPSSIDIAIERRREDANSQDKRHAEDFHISLLRRRPAAPLQSSISRDASRRKSFVKRRFLQPKTLFFSCFFMFSGVVFWRIFFSQKQHNTQHSAVYTLLPASNSNRSLPREFRNQPHNGEFGRGHSLDHMLGFLCNPRF